MAQQAVVAAVKARLQANWTTTSLQFPNEAVAPPADASAFVIVQFPVAIETFIGMAAVGSRAMRETGTIRMVVSVPRGRGIDVGLDYCATLAALFRLQTFSGVVCFEVSPPIDNNSSDIGSYWILSISARYQYDYFA